MIFVISGTEPEAYEYINRKIEARIAAGEPVESIDEYEYVSSTKVVENVKDPHGVFIGKWKEREDINDIITQLMSNTDHATSTYKTLLQLWYDTAK